MDHRDTLECVVHYRLDIKYSTIVPLNENTLERIHTAKTLREQWGGENHH